MSPEEFEKLPIIGIAGTQGNEPTGYTELQKMLLPYIDTYHSFLWLCFFGTLFYLIFKFLILPIAQDSKKKEEK
ncbi:MAG TPA: hypothetical protein PLF01_01605 [Alphaproteobacteria bacterium]|nr:hypothetical protein [Alphaproteobacteria bacterium]